MSAPLTQTGDIVQLIGEKDKNYIIALHPGEDFQTHLGVIPHDELIGQPWGARVQTHLGKSFRVLQPAFDDLIRTLTRNTQIMYPKDIGYVLVTMNIAPGVRVIEAGTGSGALTIAMANLVGETGQVYSYDVRDSHQAQARDNLALLGLQDRVTFSIGDAAEGFTERDVDALFLDLPEADTAVPAARDALFREGYDPAFGARPLKRAIQTLLANPLSLKILDGEIPAGSHIVADAGEGDGLTFVAQEQRVEA